MLLRRALIHKETRGLQKKPLFYAPLVEDLLPTIAWNEDKTIYRNTGFGMSGGCHSSTSDSALIFNCCSPHDKTALTFSCWIKPCETKITIGRTFGNTTKGVEIGRGCQFCNSAVNNRLDTEWCSIANSDTPYISLNEWQFITFTIKKTDSGWERKIYKNGILEYEGVGIIKDHFLGNPYKGVQDCNFSLGVEGSSNNSPRTYYRHFSCYEALTDEEVMLLYKIGGIPTPN